MLTIFTYFIDIIEIFKLRKTNTNYIKIAIIIIVLIQRTKSLNNFVSFIYLVLFWLYILL